MSEEKEEIRRLEKEIEVLEMLIRKHGNKEQRSIPANHGRKLATPAPMLSSTHGNRYQWIKKDLSSECSSETYDPVYTSKPSNLKRNYVMGNCSQQERGAVMQQQGCLNGSKPKTMYKYIGSQLTVDAPRDVSLGHCTTEAISNSSGHFVQPRTISTGQKLPSVQRAHTTLQKISSGFMDEKATAGNVSKCQQPVSSAESEFARTLTTEQSQAQLAATNVASEEAVVANIAAEKDVKNVASAGKDAVADNVQKNAQQPFDRSVSNQICLLSRAETVNPVCIVTPSNRSNSLCAINKYKLIRPVNENNLHKGVTSLPHSSHFACKQVLSPKKKFPRSLAPISFHEKSQNLIHKSKYKLVKSLQDSSNSNSNGVVLPDSQITPPQSSEVFGSNGTNQVHPKYHSASCDRHTYSTAISKDTAVTNISKAPANSMHIVSRYKLVKKALQTCHLKNQQISSGSRKKRSKPYWFAQPTKKKGWNTKYALKREFGEFSQMSNCINAILGRKVRNLSANKYKFINAKPVSSQHPANGVQKRRTLKIDRRKGARSSVQLRRLSWSTMVPKSASSSHLNLNQSRRRSLSSARQLSRTESWRYVTRKKSSALKVTSRLQNSSERYCIFYSRFGHCNRGDRCQYIHDPDRISVCTRFLRGTCKVTDCPFSHKVAKHKMPMCRFFLRRACNRDDCPYSHVNVAKDADVCIEFLKGFCAEGDLCKKKHMLVCSEFSESGSCPRGKGCPMRHLKKRKAEQKPNSIESRSKKSKLDCENVELNKEEDTTEAGSRSVPFLPSDDDVNLPWKERCLPAYIALNNSSVIDNSQENSSSTLITVPGCSTKLNIHPRIKMPSESTYEQIEAIIQQSSQES